MGMAEFWDARAREDAFHFVDNELPYRGADAARLWEAGERALAALLARLEVQIAPPDAVVDLGCGVVSHVVFQHLPDPELTYGYVREMGRVLRPGGWAAFQVSDDPAVHDPRRAPGRVRVLLGRAPRGQRDPAWVGSAVDLGALRAAAAGGLRVERVLGQGTQFCLVRARRSG